MAAALLVPLFLAAGQWQWDKAQSNAERQRLLEAQAAGPAVTLTAAPVDAPTLQFRRLVARGHHEPERQILIDNRTYHEQAGYQIVTPLRLEGSNVRLLVNRGWLPATPDRRQLPPVATPTGMVEVAGTAIIPATRFFTLGSEPAATGAAWQSVWQNLDLARYRQSVDFPVQPVVMQMDAASDAGGFVREWPCPDDRRQINVGYALQWWAFAATTGGLWLFFAWRRPT